MHGLISSNILRVIVVISTIFPWFSVFVFVLGQIKNQMILTLTIYCEVRLLHILYVYNRALVCYCISLRVWFGLCCFMTPGLSKDIQCHV